MVETRQQISENLHFEPIALNSSEEIISSDTGIAMQSRARMRIIIANPGSGKTHHILYEMDTLIRTKKATKQQILVLTFSKQTRADFINRMSRWQHLNGISDTCINTFHSIAGSINQKLSKKNTKFIETIIPRACDIIREYKEQIRSVAKLKNIKYLFVDEAQDMAYHDFNLITLLQQTLLLECCLVGDPQQSIFQFRGSDETLFTQCKFDTKDELTSNYRSQQNIINLLNKIKSYNKQEIKCQKIDLPKYDNILILDDQQHILQQIKQISQQGLDENKTIGIIGAVKRGRQCNLGLQLVRNYLSDEGYGEKLNILYTIDQNADSTNKQNQQINDKMINILTIHQSKGLEFSIVILIDFHFEYQNNKQRKDNLIQMNNLFFVALSRPQERLYICCNIHAQINQIYHQIKDVLTIQSSENPCKFRTSLNNNYNYIVDEQQKSLVSNLSKQLSQNYEIQKLIEQIQESQQSQQITKQLFNDSNYDDYQYIKDCRMFIGIFFEQLFIYYLDKQQYIAQIQNKQIQYIPLQITQQLIICENIVDLQILEQQYSVILKYSDICNYEKLLQQNHKLIFYNANNQQIRYKMQQVTDQIVKNSQQNIFNELSLFQLKLVEYCIEWQLDHMLIEDTYMKLFMLLKLQFEKIQYYVNILQDKLTLNIQEFRCQECATNQQIPSLIGNMDLVTNTQIIELKYAKQIYLQDYIQILLYALLHDKQQNMKYHIININTGELITLNISNELRSKFFKLCLLQSNIQIQNAIIALDFETTGLDTQECHIIDRNLTDIQFNLELSNGLVKTNKILDPNIEQLTSITNQMLINADSIQSFVADLQIITKIYKDPIIIAYNGTRFDFIILDIITRKFNIQHSWYYKDFSYFIQGIYQEKLLNNKLQTYHNYICKTNYQQEHRAKSDVKMIQNIFNAMDTETQQLIVYNRKNKSYYQV